MKLELPKIRKDDSCPEKAIVEVSGIENTGQSANYYEALQQENVALRRELEQQEQKLAGLLQKQRKADLLIYAKEFVAVAAYFRKNGLGIPKKNGRQLAVEKSAVLELLERNLYEEPLEKLKVWKALGWIAGEGRNTTKSVYVKEVGKQKRMLLLDLQKYEILLSILG